MELINVGYISGFHGVKGEVKVKATTDFPEERFAAGNKLLVTDGKEIVKLTIIQHRIHKNINMLRFAEIDNLNEIEKYKGYALKIEAEDLLE
jgi:16S rRNA processing protein RimM